MSRRKWERGRALSALEALIQIEQGRPVYHNRKFAPNAWARGWQINMLINSARRGFIFEAMKIEEPK